MTSNPHPDIHPASANESLRYHPTMSMFANVLGFSLFGLAARMGQLGIQKRNPLDSAS